MAITAEILERLQACEIDLEAHRGYIKALEYGLRAAIIAHPNPIALRSIWRTILPGVADAHAGIESSTFSAALQQALTLLTEQIEQRP